MELNVTTRCSACAGTGINDNVIPPVTCAICGGDGFKEVNKIDITALETVLTTIEAKVDAITESVDDINNKVVDIKEKVDETKEVCDKILEIVNK